MTVFPQRKKVESEMKVGCAGNRETCMERIILSLVLCFAILFPLFMPDAYAQQNQTYKTIRVGYYQATKFQEGDGENTLRSGYSYEYLQKVSTYTGWKYEYVPGEWDDLYQKLKDGEIDLLAGVSYDEKRAEEVLFSDHEMLKETFYIYKDSSDTSIQSGDASSCDGKKIGIVDDAKMVECINEWVTENHVNLTLVPFRNLDDCAKAFNHHEIDGFVSADNIVSGHSGISPVEMIGKVPYYICVSKNRPDILSELDSALAMINGTELGFLSNLNKKYAADTSISIFLSQQERQWMDTHPQVRVGYLDKYMPYSSTAKDGSVQGLLGDALAELFRVLPGDYAPTITYTAYRDQDDMVQALKANDVDVIFPVSGEYSYAEQNGFQQSSAVIRAAVDMVYADNWNDDELKRIAVNKNNQLQYEYTKIYYPDAELVLYDDTEGCLRAVKRKQVDCTLVEAIRAVELTGEDEKLHALPLENTCDFCFGVNYGNSDFLRVLNHGLGMLGEGYGLSHSYQYIGDVVNDTVKSVNRSNMIHIFSFMILLVLGYFLMRYLNLQKLSKAEAEHNQKLQDALMQAHQANYAKRVFLHSMSHDIRTPLNALSGIFEVNQRSHDPELIAANNQKAKDAIDQLLTMIDHMIQVSKLESGDILNMHADVDFNQIIHEVELSLNHRAEAANIGFTHESSSELKEYPHIYGNAACIREVLEHILENAIKYNHPNGEVIWSDRLEQTADNMVEYACTISDTGIGMKPEFLQHIFEPFSQEQYDARTIYKGSGLGMSIVKSLLDKMNGSIDITSKENSGTTVSIRIPMEIVRAEKEPLPEKIPEKTPAPEPGRIDLSGMKLLLVEDNELNIEIAQFILEDAGAAVTVAKDGEQAVKAYKRVPAGEFDAILMDIMMPVMNGFEATNAIRTSGREDAASIPIIATTACVTDDARAEGAMVGISAFMEKPLDMNKLLRMILEFKQK